MPVPESAMDMARPRFLSKRVAMAAVQTVGKMSNRARASTT